MQIGIIAWGSLVWYPRGLEHNHKWRGDGPYLPIEFARVSRDGRLTLVINPAASKVQTYWTLSTLHNLNDAIDNLRIREVTSNKYIGRILLTGGDQKIESLHEEVAADICKWAEQKSLDAVIWTDLQSNFLERIGLQLNEENAVRYLRGLEGERLIKAKEYIERAPKQISTNLRERLVCRLDSLR